MQVVGYSLGGGQLFYQLLPFPGPPSLSLAHSVGAGLLRRSHAGFILVTQLL